MRQDSFHGRQVNCRQFTPFIGIYQSTKTAASTIIREISLAASNLCSGIRFADVFRLPHLLLALLVGFLLSSGHIGFSCLFDGSLGGSTALLGRLNSILFILFLGLSLVLLLVGVCNFGGFHLLVALLFLLVEFSLGLGGSLRLFVLLRLILDLLLCGASSLLSASLGLGTLTSSLAVLFRGLSFVLSGIGFLSLLG